MTLAEAPAVPYTASVSDVLSRYWGYTSLRPLQSDAIEAGVSRRDSLVVLPTGGGKSLCYQIPPVVAGRTDVVVSPLISLMKDQVDALRANGYAAAALHSNLTEQERSDIARELVAGKLKLLFVSPERLLTPWFTMLMKRERIWASSPRVVARSGCGTTLSRPASASLNTMSLATAASSV